MQKPVTDIRATIIAWVKANPDAKATTLSLAMLYAALTPVKE